MIRSIRIATHFSSILVKPSTLSTVKSWSLYGELSADLGNDGIYDRDGNLASSKLEVSPFWLVDLTKSCYVTSVVFFNRISSLDGKH